MNTESYATEAEWKEAHRDCVSASEAPAILGLVPWRSPLAVYAAKIGAVEQEPPTLPMRVGTWLEPRVLELYVEETGRKVEPWDQWTIIRHPKHGWLIATPDALVTRNPDSSFDWEDTGPLEVKAPGLWARDEWEDEPPISAQVQWQIQAGCLAASWGAIAALIGNTTFRHQDQLLAPDFLDRAIPRLSEFLERVRHREPPPPDWTDSSTAALAALHPQERTGMFVDLPAEAAAWDEELQTLKDQSDAAERRVKELKNFLRQAIGDAEAGLLPTGVRWTCKTKHIEAHTVKEHTYRDLRRIAPRGEK